MVRGNVYLVGLDDRSEMRKTRPCLIVSPDERAGYLRPNIIAPMTPGGRAYPWRVPCRFAGRAGFVALDQIRTVEGSRLMRRLSQLPDATLTDVQRVLQEMFAD